MAAISQSLPAPSTEPNVIIRVSELPLVKDSLSTAYSLVQSNSYSSAVYSQAERISQQILSLAQPLGSRLPVAYANTLGNSAVDYIEKVVPGVGTIGAADLINQIKGGPAGPVIQIAQDRLLFVSEALQNRLQQAHATVATLESRFNALTASVPKDKAAASEIVNSLFRELDSLSTYIATQRTELPAHAQKTVQPILDRLQESFTHIRDEAASEAPIATKATSIVSYSRTQLSPLLNDAVTVVKTVIEGITSKAEEVKETVQVNGEKLEEKVEEKIEKVEKKSKKSRSNGTA